MTESTHARRRIDRVTAPDFLEGVEERSPAELREMRDDCRQEESRLSYRRRLVQGQLDIARVEQLRRAGDAVDEGTLLSELPAILADEPSERGPADARSAPLYTPQDDERRRADADAIGGAIANVPELSDTDLIELLDHLQADEQRLSAQRRIVLDHLDHLQAELVRRYRDGSIGLDDVVGTTLSPSPDHS